MAGAPEDGAGRVAVFGGRARGPAVAGAAGLRDFLVGDSVEILLRVEVVVAVEYDGDMVLFQQFADRRRPAGAVLGESVGAVRVFAAPFVERRGFCAAAALVVCSADQMASGCWNPSPE